MTTVGNTDFGGLFTLLRRRSYKVKNEEFIKRRASGPLKRKGSASRYGLAEPWVREQAIKASEEHQSGLLDEFADFVEESSPDGSIDHTVVTREAKVHPEAWNDLAVLDDGFLDCGTDR